MDKSYKIKLESWLTAKTVNKQLLLSCLSAFEAKASRLAVKREKYKHSIDSMCQATFAEADAQMRALVEYRKPFVAVLCNDYHLSLKDIKVRITATLDNPKLRKNIPTRQDIDRVRDLILSGYYSVVP